jgi:8-oxo-dGTP diphosphatase
MKHIALATGLVRRGERLLVVASDYPSHAMPLWNLPGGRERPGELLADTVVREILEETGLVATVVELAYVSESYDGEVHFLNATFEASASGELVLPRRGDHVVDAEWVTIPELPSYLHVEVVRVPLLRYLNEGLRYSGYEHADITIRWSDEP